MKQLGWARLLTAAMAACIWSVDTHGQEIEYTRTKDWVITSAGTVCTARNLHEDEQKKSGLIVINIEYDFSKSNSQIPDVLLYHPSFSRVKGTSQFKYNLIDGKKIIESSYPYLRLDDEYLKKSSDYRIRFNWSRSIYNINSSDIFLKDSEGRGPQLHGKTTGLVEAVNIVLKCAAGSYQNRPQSVIKQEKEITETMLFCAQLPQALAYDCGAANRDNPSAKVMSYRDFLLDENQLLYRPIQVEGMVGRTKDGTYGIYDKNGENGRILILDRAPRDDRGAVLDKCSEGCDAVVTGRPTPIGLFATGVAVVD